MTLVCLGVPVIVRVAVRCLEVEGPYLTEDGNEAKKGIYFYFWNRKKKVAVIGLLLPQVLKIYFDEKMVLMNSFLKLGIS